MLICDLEISGRHGRRVRDCPLEDHSMFSMPVILDDYPRRTLGATTFDSATLVWIPQSISKGLEVLRCERPSRGVEPAPTSISISANVRLVLERRQFGAEKVFDRETSAHVMVVHQVDRARVRECALHWRTPHLEECTPPLGCIISDRSPDVVGVNRSEMLTLAGAPLPDRYPTHEPRARPAPPPRRRS